MTRRKSKKQASLHSFATSQKDSQEIPAICSEKRAGISSRKELKLFCLILFSHNTLVQSLPSGYHDVSKGPKRSQRVLNGP